MGSLDFLEYERERDSLKDPLLQEAEDSYSNKDALSFDPSAGFKVQQQMDEAKMEQLVSETIDEAHNVNPDEAARVKKLSRVSGLPEELVQEDPAAIEKSLQAEKNKGILEHSPKLKKASLDFSKYAHDDFDNLSVFERLHTDFTVGLDTGMLTREMGFARRKLMGKVFSDDLAEPEKQVLRDRIKEIQASLQEPNEGSKGFIQAAAQAVGTFIEGVPQVLAAGATASGAALVGGGLATGPAAPGVALTAFGVGAVAEVFRQSSAIEGGLATQDMLDAGVDKDTANNVGEAVGIVNGILEAYGTKIVSAPFKDIIKDKVLKGVKRKVLEQTSKKSSLAAGAKTFGKTVAGETATEIGQEVSNIIGLETAKGITDNQTTPITASEAFHQVLEVTKETLKAMTILGIPGMGVSIIRQNQQGKQALANQDHLNKVSENVQASLLKQRDGESHAQFVERVAEGTPLDKVYIDANKLQEVFQEDTELLVEEIGATDQFSGAIEAKGDIVIPYSTFVNKIAGDINAHGKISPHVKFDVNGLTSFETESIQKDEDVFKERAEKILKDQGVNIETLQSSERVFEGVKEQLVLTGRFNDETADNYASLHQSYAIVMGSRLGITPEQVYEKFGLKIKGEAVDGQQTLDQQALAVREAPENQKFFAESSVVDEDGEPIMLFHSTLAPEIKEFRVNAENELGAHFGTSDQQDRG